MAPNMPGFYFDQAKGKYFQIQPNHIAPKGSKYSEQSVKKEKEATHVGTTPFRNFSCKPIKIIHRPLPCKMI